MSALKSTVVIQQNFSDDRIGPRTTTQLSNKFLLIPHPRFPNFLKTRHLKEDSQKISDLVVRAAMMLRTIRNGGRAGRVADA